MGTVEIMRSVTAPMSEPTNSEIMAELRAMRGDVGGLGTRMDGLRDDLTQLSILVSTLTRESTVHALGQMGHGDMRADLAMLRTSLDHVLAKMDQHWPDDTGDIPDDLSGL